MSVDPAWEAEHASRPWGRWPNEHLVRFVARSFRTGEYGVFLDLGCGGGAQTAFLAESGHDVHAVDASESAIDRAQSLVEKRCGSSASSGDRYVYGGSGTFVWWKTMDVASVEMPAASLDCVVDIACLQHIDRPEAAGVVHRALSWLKPGGRFFSLMTSTASDLDLVSPSGVNVRREDRAGVEAIFAGYETAIGHERIERPIGGVIGNWIIEAQKPA